MRLLLFLLASSLSAGALAQGIFDDNEARRRPSAPATAAR